MTITKEQLNLLMKLANLKVEGEALNEFQQELSRILDLMDELQQVNTEDLLPLTNPRDDKQRLRRDEVTETNQRARWQQNAPETEAGLYLVPRVVD